MIPILLGFALIEGSKENKSGIITVPRFIFLFIGASLLASYLSLPSLLIETTALLSKSLLVAALFLVGIATTRENLDVLNAKHLIQGLTIWALVVVATLGFVITQI